LKKINWQASDWIRDGAARSHRIDELYELIARVAPSRTNDQWLDALRSYDVPCAVVNSLQEIFADDQLAASGILQTMDDAELGSLRYLQPVSSPTRRNRLRRVERLIWASTVVKFLPNLVWQRRIFSGSSQTAWSVTALNKTR
jgi:crotonobetainyl-CoA:carnitine CoA-transferase CaiB-like acyl-CoA transferase